MKAARFMLQSALVCSPFLAQASNSLNQVFQQDIAAERAQISQTYRISTPSDKLHRDILQSFHHALQQSGKDYHIVTLTSSELEQLQSLGLTIEPATSWQESQLARLAKLADSGLQDDDGTIPEFSCYKTVESTYETAASLATDNPTLAKWVDIGDSWVKTQGQGQSGYDLRVLQITHDNDVADKPILFIHASMHAREYTPAALTLEFAEKLIAEFETNADINWILNRHEIHIMFMMNPDGRKKAEQGLSWRKNANAEFCTTDEETIGVDLNRNFSEFWAVTGGEGSSYNECSLVYHGPHKASEPETQAVEAYVRSIFDDNRGAGSFAAAPDTTSGIHLDMHSYGELVLYPWGHTEEAAPNGPALATLARKFAYFNDHVPKQSIGLYATDGTSDSVSYGELGVAAFTFELGNEFFQDCQTYEDDIRDVNIDALLYAGKVVSAPYLLPSGPEVSGLKLNGLDAVVLSPGTKIQISATVTDEHFQAPVQQDTPEDVQDITLVQYSIDGFPGDPGVETINVDVADGAADSATESIAFDLVTDEFSIGKYQLFMRAQDASGSWGVPASLFFEMGTNTPPNAVIDADCNVLRCQFNSEQSDDSDHGIHSVHWDFGDGNTSTQANPEHLYAESGVYQVVLTVTDNAGALAQVSQDVEAVIANVTPSVAYDMSCNGLACQFDGSGSHDSDGEIVRFDWQFGDGNTGQGVTFNHDYAEPGEYQVSLSVTDDGGMSQSLRRTLVVTESTSIAPVASFSTDCNELSCSFDAASSQDEDGQIMQYQWLFGDNGSAAGMQVSNAYATAGNYQVQLTVTDDQGLSHSLTKAVNVSESATTNPPPTTTPPVTSSGSSGGGSLSIWALLSLAWMGRARRS